ncbi:hypothetical protein AQUCO_00800191v1 [Aquilegia coerulea]|uniref:NAC domain-containing protein n=1 Tax=Aquilegia coerulea TaxID=218851 RepID=A0A2G5EI81_AQUCA|nr:hypothetical protein AQUCO_00800191v1 [Aquilegia coerulea]
MMKMQLQFRLAPGMQFLPSPQQLIQYYLHRKLAGEELLPEVIVTKDLYGNNAVSPWELLEGCTKNEELYYFTLVKKKNGGKNIDRVTKDGTWKMDNTKPVMDSNKNVIGYCTTLTLKVDENKFNKNHIAKHWKWIMHEYSMKDGNNGKEYWVVSGIKRGSSTTTNNNEDDEELSKPTSLKRSSLDEFNDIDDLSNKNMKRPCVSGSPHMVASSLQPPASSKRSLEIIDVYKDAMKKDNNSLKVISECATTMPQITLEDEGFILLQQHDQQPHQPQSQAGNDNYLLSMANEVELAPTSYEDSVPWSIEPSIDPTTLEELSNYVEDIEETSELAGFLEMLLTDDELPETKEEEPTHSATSYQDIQPQQCADMNTPETTSMSDIWEGLMDIVDIPDECWPSSTLYTTPLSTGDSEMQLIYDESVGLATEDFSWFSPLLQQSV